MNIIELADRIFQEVPENRNKFTKIQYTWACQSLTTESDKYGGAWTVFLVTYLNAIHYTDENYFGLNHTTYFRLVKKPSGMDFENNIFKATTSGVWISDWGSLKANQPALEYRLKFTCIHIRSTNYIALTV